MKSFTRILLNLMVGILAMGLQAQSIDQGGGPDGPGVPLIHLAITSPPEGARFDVGAPIRIQATAISGQDGIYRLEFYDGSRRIGVSEILTLVPIRPGEPAHHEFLWQDAPAGRHELRVKASILEFPTLSSPVTVVVGEAVPEARVVFLQPVDGAELNHSDGVDLVAEATDPEGLLDVLEFYANGELIGTSHIDFCPPCPEPPNCPLGPCMLPMAGTTLTHHFRWERPAAGKYALEARAVRPDGQAAVSASVRIAITPVETAALAWVSPDAESVWNTPGEVPLEVTAVDPDGEIRRVEFWADDQVIGVSEILTREVEIPGRPRTHQLKWNNPLAGTHAIQANAVARAGQTVVTDPRKIIVVGDSATPVVWVEAVGGPAVEGQTRDDGAQDSLRFRLHRRGNPRRDLAVFFHWEGSAEAGADYRAPLGPVQLGAGQDSTDLVVNLRDDRLSEGRESVILKLDPSPTMGPMELYRIDPERGVARGVIEDDEPGFAFLEPAESSAHPPGAPITIRVVTTWAPDFVSHLEFLADGRKIGDSVVTFIQAPPPGTRVPHEFVWLGAPVGEHRLTVQTVFADGTVVASAEARNIRVGADGEVPEVSLTVVDAEFSEGDADTAEVIVRRTGRVEQALTVFLQWEGTATPGRDYGRVPKQVAFAPGEKEVHLRLVGVHDDQIEGDESVEIAIIHPPTRPGMILYQIAPGADRVKLVLHDGSGGEIPVVTVQTGRPYALEGDRFNRGEFILTRSGDLSGDLTILFSLSGKATRGGDYHLVLNPCDDCAAPDQEVTGDSVVMPAGQVSVVLGVVATFDGQLDVVEPVLEDVSLQVYTPPVPAVLGAKPPYVAGAPDQATVQVVERWNLSEPAVVLIAPEAGSVLPPNVPVMLRAIAVDPKGSIRRVEFLANNEVIGVSEITTEEVDIPGRLRVHAVLWTLDAATPAGSYDLTAQAHDAHGVVIGSNHVPVTFGEVDPALPVVAVQPGKSPAWERGDLKSRTGGFVLSRDGGNLSEALSVWVEVSGTARQGVDYQWVFPTDGGVGSLPFFGSFLPVTFPPGAGETTLSFVAASDEVVEGEETVALRLIDPPILALDLTGIFPGRPFYRIGNPSTAEVAIEDGHLDWPSISLTQPSEGSRFHVGDVIPLVATAVRPDAGVEMIQFVADGQVIATVNYCCDVCDCAPAPTARPFTARFEWRSATAGVHVLTARTILSANLVLESPPVTITVGDSQPGSLVIVSPSEGSVFKPGETITIDTIGQEPGALVSTVEFFANGNKIGETCFVCVVRQIIQPGTPLHNQIQWTPSQPGRYELTAIGQFGSDHRITSLPVTIEVGRRVGPQLTIVSPKNGAEVPAENEVAVVAIGVGREGGITDVQLLVDGKPAGESHLTFFRPPGVNEEVRHEFTIRLEPGSHQLTVQDLNDATLISPPVTVIAGRDSARITWVSPEDGSEFADGKAILLEVLAVDPTGNIFQMEFLDGDEVIGFSQFDCPTCRFLPGAAIPHQLLWLGAAPGQHVLTARATLPTGVMVTSPPRLISVISDSDAFVTRFLPDNYEQGRSFTIRLETRPAETVAAYVVEEQPPYTLPAPGLPDQQWPFWRVVSASHDGVFDPLTGKVKFGPFYDHQPRTLIYELVADLTVPVARFDGVGVADGTSLPIGGDRELRSSVRHPADVQAADNSIGAGELTAYAAAWKREQGWAEGPNPIPVDYVTRAAVLWKAGERYSYDPAAGSPPFCWVSGVQVTPYDDRSVPVASLAGLALRVVEPQSDGSQRIRIRVTPAPGVQAFAIEEYIPENGTVSGITADGNWAPGTRIIRWGPFFTGDHPELGYVISGTTPGHGPKGIVSFDGQNVSIHDEAEAEAPDASPARLVGVDPLHDGSHQVSLEGSDLDHGGGYELQISSDLKHWSPVGLFSSGTDAAFARDTAGPGTEVRFYRAIQRP